MKLFCMANKFRWIIILLIVISRDCYCCCWANDRGRVHRRFHSFELIFHSFTSLIRPIKCRNLLASSAGSIKKWNFRCRRCAFTPEPNYRKTESNAFDG